MAFKKRTKEQEDSAIANGDFTGGYEFWPWLIFKRKYWLVIVPTLFLFSFGILDDSYENGDLVNRTSGIIGIIMGIFLMVRIEIEFKKLKKGDSNS